MLPRLTGTERSGLPIQLPRWQLSPAERRDGKSAVADRVLHVVVAKQRPELLASTRGFRLLTGRGIQARVVGQDVAVGSPALLHVRLSGYHGT